MNDEAGAPGSTLTSRARFKYTSTRPVVTVAPAAQHGHTLGDGPEAVALAQHELGFVLAAKTSSGDVVMPLVRCRATRMSRRVEVKASGCP
jgi:hypothetical protein